MYFFDTHLHLPAAGVIDPDLYYRKASDADVKYLLACSSGFEDSIRSAAFAAMYPDVYFAAGVHPHEAKDMAEPVSAYEEFALKTRFAAIGEIGLDFYYEFSDKKVQERVFREFLELALKLDVPALVHCRDKDGTDEAYDICYSLLKDFSGSGGSFVLHAFAGSLSWTEKFLELNSYFGIGGMLTFKKADNIREIASFLPMERILLETDAPYLAPVPFRGKENHPALLPHIAEKLSLLKNMTLSECAGITTGNAFRFLKINNSLQEPDDNVR